VQKIKYFVFVIVAAMCLCFMACGASDDLDRMELSTPIHMEIPTDHIQPAIGLSGFVFGTFLLLNAYLIIVVSCIILIMKESTVIKLLDTLRMVMSMLNPSPGAESKSAGWLNMLADGTTRIQIGSAGLVIGILMAYFGAWVAM